MRTDARMVKVESIIEESKDVKSLVFKDMHCHNAKPGQFIMVWIPGVDEIPMSVMIDPLGREGYTAVTVRRHGYATSALYALKEGDMIGIRGPYGKSFKVYDKHKRLALVGGGTGLVPLIRLCKYVKERYSDNEIILVMGFKSRDDIFFEDIAERMLTGNDRLIVTTDDGTYGMKGYATDALEDVLKQRVDAVYTCGPERMMYKVLSMAEEHGIYAQASLERVMKCAIGICGSCAFGKYILCKDGPVMDARDALRVDDFGRYARDKSGRVVSI